MTGVQIFPGDVVVFARGCLSDNGLYVVSLRGEVLVKRLEFDQVHNRMSIISENPNYRPIVVDADDEVLISTFFWRWTTELICQGYRRNNLAEETTGINWYCYPKGP